VDHVAHDGGPAAVAYRSPVPSSRSQSLAEQLLDAQVRHHLGELSGDRLAATLSAGVGELLDAGERRRLDELVDRGSVKEIVVRVLGTVPASPAVRDIVDLVTTLVSDGPRTPCPVGDLVDRAHVESLVDTLLRLTPVLERALDRLTASPLVGTTASRFMGRIVGEVLQANRAVAGKVPGLGTLMSFGTSAASKMMGAADKQFEGLINDTVGKGGTFAVRRLNRIVLETLRDPTTRDAVLQVWDLLAKEKVVGLSRYAGRAEVDGVVEAVQQLLAASLSDQHVAELGEVVVDAFFDRFGALTPIELLDRLALSRDDVVADLVRLAPGIVEALRETGDLERILRARLAPFSRSAEVRDLLA
jgi:hypothetical protein